MSLAGLSTLLFRLGRRRPRLPLALLRVVPLDLLHRARQPGFRETLRWASRAAFYRDEFTRRGVDLRRIRRPDELGDFFLTPEVLKSRAESLLSASPELAIESAGTSGRISRVYLSRAELEYSAQQCALMFALYDLRPRDRLLCTLDLAFGLGSLLVERAVRRINVFAMVVGRVDPQEAYRRLADYRFNVLVSDPFWFARLTEIARARGLPTALKLLIGGGEGVTPRTRAELERFWGAPLCMTYASTEAATTLGFECAHRDGYHVNEFDFHVEIDRPDAEGYGELILTTMHRQVMPLIRYRTGDVARWLTAPCRCGLPFRRLSPLRGRVDETVSCVWGNIHPEFFEPLVRNVRGLAGDWQVALGERDLKPVFQFRLEVVGDDRAREAAMQTVLTALEHHHPEAWNAYRQRLTDIEFRFLGSGELRRRRKLLRLVDERAALSPDWTGNGAGVRRAEPASAR
jgi:phenylacetate-CoA ligase